MKRIYVLILIALIFSPFVSFAAEIRSGGNISVSGEAPIEQNAYIGSAKVVVDQEIKGDLSLAAMDAEVKSTITGDVIITGGTVHFSGVGKDDVKIAGSTVIFSGKAEKDLILLGGTLRVEEGAVINGDVIILGGNVFFAGQSGRDTKIVAGNVYVDGYLKGNTEITTQHLILADGIKIEGNLSYFSPEQVSVKESSVVGEVSYNRIETIRDNSFVKRMILNVVSFWILLRFISTLLLAFILVYVFRFFTQKTVTFATKRWGMSLGIGILFLTLVPIIAVVLSLIHI